MSQSDDNIDAPGTAADSEVNGETLAWTTHPLKRRPFASVLVTVFILVVGFLVFVSTTSKTFGTLALVVLFASLAKFYLPTRYRLTGERIAIKTTTQTIRKTWSQFRSYYPDKNGVLLSPFVRPSRLENFRGIYLIFENNRDEVLRFVKDHIGTGPSDAETEKSE